MWGIQDSLGFWIPRRGFRNFRYWIPVFVSGTWIPDSKAQDFGFHKQKFPFHEAKDTLADAARLNGPGLKEKPLIPFRFDHVH